MANLRQIEIDLISKFFERKDQVGYVMDFTNSTFRDFFDYELATDIDAPIYARNGTSKGKRLRTFFQIVDDQTAARCLRVMIQHREELTDVWVAPQASKVPQISALITRLESGGPTAQQNVVAPYTLEHVDYSGLADRLLAIKNTAPHQRGRDFEVYLTDLFRAFGLKAVGSFRNTGEEIDGSFELDHEIYLLEAKWWANPMGAPELHVLKGKLSQKATWTRGLFVSFEGFTDVGLAAFGKGSQLICASGEDIFEALRSNVRIDDLLRAKVRAASHTGAPFTPFRSLDFPSA